MRCAGLPGINTFSEFAGLPYEEQRAKLDRGCWCLQKHGVRADVWVAPGRCGGVVLGAAADVEFRPLHHNDFTEGRYPEVRAQHRAVLIFFGSMDRVIRDYAVQDCGLFDAAV